MQHASTLKISFGDMRCAVGNNPPPPTTPTSYRGSKRILKHFCVPLLCPLPVWIQIISCSDKRTKGNENKIFMYLIVFAISISYDVELISSMVYVIFHSLLSGMKRPWNKRPISNISDADLLNKRNTPISKINVVHQCRHLRSSVPSHEHCPY